MTMHLKVWARTALAVVLVGAAPIYAESIQSEPPTITSLGGGLYQWAYDPVYVTRGSQVWTNDFFTIYNFGGYVANSIFFSALNSATWTATVENTSTPGTVNLKFTYTGGTPLGPNADLGTFGAVSTTDVAVASYIIGHDHAAQTGLPSTNTYGIETPASISPVAVSESNALSELAMYLALAVCVFVCSVFRGRRLPSCSHFFTSAAGL